MNTAFTIFRPVNLLIAVVTCVVFRILAAGEIGEWTPFLVYTLGVVCLMIGGYLINDYIDYKTDAINKPNKNHFTDKKSYINLVVVFYAAAFISGLYVSTFKGYSSTSIVFSIVLFLLFLYSILLQYLPLIGNITIGFIAVLLYIPLYEGIVLNATLQTFIGLSFIITLARELVKDLEDQNGDEAARYKTFPILAGATASKALMIVYLAISMNALFSTFWNQISTFILIVLFFSIILLLTASVLALFIGVDAVNPTRAYKRSSLLLKIAMVVFIGFVYSLTI